MLGMFMLAPSVWAAEAMAADASLDALAEKILRESDVPALGAAFVRVGKAPEIGVAGLRKRGGKEAVTHADKWHLGSDTKAMTALLVGLMVEEGKLRWNSTLAEIFPERDALFQESVGRVTVDQLLRHCSGLKANADWQAVDRKLELRKQREAVIADLPKQMQKKESGRFSYSNLGYMVLGAVLEKRSGQDWETLMRERVFKPLGMNSAGFGGTGTPGQVDQPWPHGESGRPTYKNGPNMDNPPVMAPAGCVHASLEDWARFVEEYLKGLRGEGRLAKRETYTHLATPVDGAEMACGWGVTQRPWGGVVLTHAGSNTMNYAVAWLSPERGVAFLAVSNQGGPKAGKSCDKLCAEMIQRQR